MAFQLHPLCTLFPRITGAEFESLKSDIAAHGLRQPIVLHGGMVLDGGNRYRACQELGIEPETVEFVGTDLAAYVLSANMHRRHLAPGQQATIVAKATDWDKAQMHGGNRQAEALPLETVADRAAISGATERTQRDADKLVREHPELAEEVTQGRKSLYQAVKETKEAERPGAVKTVPAGGVIESAHGSKSNSSIPPTGADDHEPDLARELEEADKEIQRLTQLVEDLSKTDLAKEVRDWSMKFDQVCGRNAQLQTTCNEAQTQARRNGELLTKIRKALGVQENAQILPALNK